MGEGRRTGKYDGDEHRMINLLRCNGSIWLSGHFGNQILIRFEEESSRYLVMYIIINFNTFYLKMGTNLTRCWAWPSFPYRRIKQGRHENPCSLCSMSGLVEEMTQ